MSQSEVLQFLKRYKSRWFSSKEISKKVNASYSVISANITKLRHSNLIRAKKVIGTNRFEYRYMRLE